MIVLQVFLHVAMANRKKLQLRRRDIEWWMRRRQLPSSLRQRVRHFETQTWDTMGGEEEMKWIEELPDGLRRDIKRYLCLDLIKKVTQKSSSNVLGLRTNTHPNWELIFLGTTFR